MREMCFIIQWQTQSVGKFHHLRKVSVEGFFGWNTFLEIGLLWDYKQWPVMVQSSQISASWKWLESVAYSLSFPQCLALQWKKTVIVMVIVGTYTRQPVMVCIRESLGKTARHWSEPLQHLQECNWKAKGTTGPDISQVPARREGDDVEMDKRSMQAMCIQSTFSPK